MKILAIETSCDDTCVAVLEDDRILANIISSQVDLYEKWGGVVPDIAKRAHMERIEPVIAQALMRSKSTPTPSFEERRGIKLSPEEIIEKEIKNIDVIGVTQGPGLAIALGIGVNKAKELAKKYNKKLVAVNHIEGHLMANLLKHKTGTPEREIKFPALVLTVSGGHTKIVLIQSSPSPFNLPLTPSLTRGGTEQGQNPSAPMNIGASPLKKGRIPNQIFKPKYTIVGETLDDAAGEALDKAAKMLGLGYPGGPIIERLAKSGNKKFLELPRPLADKKILDFSFSGLKTSFYYKIKDWPKERIFKNINDLAASFQNAVFDSLLRKFKLAIEKYEPKTLLASGGVLSNLELRKQLRKLAHEKNLPIWMPTKKELNTDNAAMIGMVTYQKALRGEFVEDIDKLDRDPRLSL